jgi:hypothetical protein
MPTVADAPLSDQVQGAEESVQERISSNQLDPPA